MIKLQDTAKINCKDLLKFLIIIFLTSLVTSIVYFTGGTKGSWPQLYFVIIILSGYYWKILGSLLVAFLLGIITGPFMPLDVSQGIMQTPENWIIRMMIFILVGFFSGYFIQKIAEINILIRDKDFINEFTGLFNTNKLLPEIEKFIENNETFGLVFFNIKNLEELTKYISYDMAKNIVQHCIKRIKLKYDNDNLYSSNFNELILVLSDFNEDNIHTLINDELDDILKLIKIDDYSFHLTIKIGIAFSNGNEFNAVELLRKARIASSQGEYFESGVYIYDLDFDNDAKMFHEVSGSIQSGIDNGEFYLVYQPIISLKDNSISKVEVLARWNRGSKIPIGPGIFVKIAEETGQIKSFTKEIISQHLNQVKIWNSKELKIRSSINITAGELIDDDFLKNIIKEVDLVHNNKSYFGIEVTERVLSSDGKKLSYVLSDLKEMGYIISIDDFGTGYNTFIDLIEMQANIIKIDKYFIDRLDEKHTKLLIKYIIDLVHEMGITVVAEGVETKEQLITLKEIGCDEIQGYYFSKPLLPKDLENYYKSFDIKKYL